MAIPLADDNQDVSGRPTKIPPKSADSGPPYPARPAQGGRSVRTRIRGMLQRLLSNLGKASFANTISLVALIVSVALPLALIREHRDLRGGVTSWEVNRDRFVVRFLLVNVGNRTEVLYRMLLVSHGDSATALSLSVPREETGPRVIAAGEAVVDSIIIARPLEGGAYIVSRNWPPPIESTNRDSSFQTWLTRVDSAIDKLPASTREAPVDIVLELQAVDRAELRSWGKRIVVTQFRSFHEQYPDNFNPDSVKSELEPLLGANRPRPAEVFPYGPRL
jgi:hypothetical protein